MATTPTAPLRGYYTSKYSGEEIDALLGRVSRTGSDNQLDNAYWANKDAIINQRGQTEYYSRGYTIDRWKINSISDTGLSVQLTSDGIVFKKSVADAYGSFCQKLENPKWLTGKNCYILHAGKGQYRSVPADLFQWRKLRHRDNERPAHR